MTTKWIDENSVEYVIAIAYAESKGYFYNVFFGWRQSRDGMARIILSKHGWKHVDELKRYYEVFCYKEPK